MKPSSGQRNGMIALMGIIIIAAAVICTITTVAPSATEEAADSIITTTSPEKSFRPTQSGLSDPSVNSNLSDSLTARPKRKSRKHTSAPAPTYRSPLDEPIN